MTTVPIDRASADFMEAANRLPSLYSLSGDYAEIVARIERADSDEEADAWAAELDALLPDIRSEAERLIGVSRWFDVLADGRRAEVARIEAGARAYEAKAASVRAYVLKRMKEMGIERIDTPRYSLAIRQNPLSVTVVDASAIPADFQRQKVIVEPDKRAILDAFKRDGEVVPGTVVGRTERLEVK